jgi:hypothetical protein
VIILVLCVPIIPVTTGKQSSTDVCGHKTLAGTLLQKYSEIAGDDGTLSGYVTDPSMHPIEGARVRVYFHDTFRESYSDASGHYVVTGIPLCFCAKNVTCTRENYHPEWILLNIGGTTVHDFQITPLPVQAEVIGTTGTNGWYTSVVNITLVNTDPMNISTCYYALNESAWMEYTSQIPVKVDGNHILHWYWKDSQGTSSEVFWINIKIDRTAPIVEKPINTCLNFLGTKWLISEQASDATSGIVLVEFYVDDILVGNATAPPYEIYYQGRIHNHTQVIAYDAAGNKKLSPIPTARNPTSLHTTGTYHSGGVLFGRVVDDEGNPITNARVRVYFHDTYAEDYTDDVGAYSIQNIPLCVCLKKVECSKMGYYLWSEMVNISGSTLYDVVLHHLLIYPVLSGTPGLNAWFVSDVTVTFTGHGNGTVVYFFYAIDESPWMEYCAPFGVSGDGQHFIHWFWTDAHGNASEVFWAGFKIDRTPPYYSNFLVERTGVFRWNFTADVTDNTSGINRVEFSVGHTIVGYDDTPPYVYVWKGFMIQVWLKSKKIIPRDLVQSIAYDNAGHATQSPLVCRCFTYIMHYG